MDTGQAAQCIVVVKMMLAALLFTIKKLEEDPHAG
jgi:hypothetical protein